MLCVEPRSIWIHCGSENADDHRVEVLPSTAADAGVPAFCVDEAVAGRFTARLVVPQLAAAARGAPNAGISRPVSKAASAAIRLAEDLARRREPGGASENEDMALLARK
jgi:hypothetical protein